MIFYFVGGSFKMGYMYYVIKGLELSSFAGEARE
jgi:hypothetical protein